LTATDDDAFDQKTTIVPYDVHTSSGGGPSVCFDGDTGVITVTGSDSGDTVVVNSPKGKVRVAADFLPGPNQFVDFPAANVTQIVALLGGGNDVFTVSGNVSLPIIAVGGAGDDTLAGGRFRNILIGGIGADTLYGGRGEDVLIGGSTDHDANAAALLALMAEWSSSHTLEERIRNLVNGTGTVGGGANGAVFLTDGATGTIHDDGDVDILISGAGTDWLFLNGTAEHLLALGSNHDLIGDDLDSLF
jgi:Ca2+-binding RTX toxin-like protein